MNLITVCQTVYHHYFNLHCLFHCFFSLFIFIVSHCSFSRFLPGIRFVGKGAGKAVLSCSLDGTVRAHDLLRYAYAFMLFII